MGRDTGRKVAFNAAAAAPLATIRRGKYPHRMFTVQYDTYIQISYRCQRI